jgi:hypothetical protein
VCQVKLSLLVCFQVFESPELKKAKASVDKAHNFNRRERMFIHWNRVEEMLTLSESRPELRACALLCLFCYAFLLRMPSEALPAVSGGDGAAVAQSYLASGSNSVVCINGESLVLYLQKRKNKPQGSKLARKCTCAKAPGSCVYHLIGQLVKDTPVGERLFGSLKAGGVHARWEPFSVQGSVSLLMFQKWCTRCD